MTRIYTTRRLKSASGADIKNTNGKYIRVNHKEKVLKSRNVSMAKAANTAYAQRFQMMLMLKNLGKKLVTNQGCSRCENEKEEKENCPICPMRATQGYHNTGMRSQLCTKCIFAFQRKNNCPMCRATVPEAVGQRNCLHIHIS